MRAPVLRWLVLLAGCDSTKPSEPGAPRPWKSGSFVKAQVFVGEGMQALAGRHDIETLLTCPVDELNPPSFASCPPQVDLLWRDTDCINRDIANHPMDARSHIPLEQYAVGLTDDGLQYVDVTEVYNGTAATRPAGSSYCTEPAGGANKRFAKPIDPNLLRLGQVSAHVWEGVEYEALETEDGFSVITKISDGVPVFEGTGRIQAKFIVNGDVRMYAGLYDRERDAPCIAVDAGDGSVKCVPPSDTASFGLGGYNMQDCNYGVLRFSTTAGDYVTLEPGLGRQRLGDEYACRGLQTVYALNRPSPCTQLQAYPCTRQSVFPTLTILTLVDEG